MSTRDMLPECHTINFVNARMIMVIRARMTIWALDEELCSLARPCLVVNDRSWSDVAIRASRVLEVSPMCPIAHLPGVLGADRGRHELCCLFGLFSADERALYIVTWNDNKYSPGVLYRAGDPALLPTG